jgi:hypothetical protein
MGFEGFFPVPERYRCSRAVFILNMSCMLSKAQDCRVCHVHVTPWLNACVSMSCICVRMVVDKHVSVD